MATPALPIPAAARQDLDEFVQELVQLYRSDLISITVFGSAASGGYAESTSDLNLLVVYSDLNIADLNKVAKLAQRWMRKRRIVPRFLSERNLVGSARYFQIDYLDMRQARVVLFGKDVLAGFEVNRADLHWQLSHEIKRMRMRIKQQFWQAAGNRDRLRAILTSRFSSLVHLIAALLFLEGASAPLARREVVERAIAGLGLDRAFADRMMALRDGRVKPGEDELVAAFPQLMDAIRLVDERVDRVAV